MPIDPPARFNKALRAELTSGARVWPQSVDLQGGAHSSLSLQQWAALPLRRPPSSNPCRSLRTPKCPPLRLLT